MGGRPGTSADSLQERSLILRGTQRGEYTDPEMAQRAINEQEAISELLPDWIAAHITSQVLLRLPCRDEDASSPELYWRQIKRYAEDARNAGRHPVLLVENSTVPGWLWKWTHAIGDRQESAPEDLFVWRDDKIQAAGYLGSLNDVPVYRAPLASGASILLTQESLTAVRFTQLHDGSFVRVEPLNVESQPDLINLRLSWWFDLDLDSYPVTKLVYGKGGQAE